MTVSLIAIAIRALALLIIIRLAGTEAVKRPFEHLQYGWIWVVAATELVTFPAYVLAYRSLAWPDSVSRPKASTLARIVVSGFGPLAVSGGFGVDKRAWRVLEQDEARAQARVGAMATLEWAVLAPVAALVALGLLVSDARVSSSLLWPWALGVPAGVVAAWWATAPGRSERLARPFGVRVAAIARTLDGLAAVRLMASRPRAHAGAWGGVSLYWAAEVCAFFAALRAAGLDLGIWLGTLAYATGYLASRRALPLGGAGVTEALLLYSLYELREPLGPSVAAVLIYRVFNFLILVVPALIAYYGLTPALIEAERRAGPPAD